MKSKLDGQLSNTLCRSLPAVNYRKMVQAPNNVEIEGRDRQRKGVADIDGSASLGCSRHVCQVGMGGRHPQIPDSTSSNELARISSRDGFVQADFFTFVELNYFPALLRGNPRHFSLKAVRDVKLDYLCHGSRQRALWNGASSIATIANHPEP